VTDHAAWIDQERRALQAYRSRAVICDALDERAIRVAEFLAGVGEERKRQAEIARERFV
jgi:hypothetical protein